MSTMRDKEARKLDAVAARAQTKNWRDEQKRKLNKKEVFSQALSISLHSNNGASMVNERGTGSQGYVTSYNSDSEYSSNDKSCGIWQQGRKR